MNNREEEIWVAIARTQRRFGQWLIDRLKGATFFGAVGIIGTLVIAVPIINETFRSVVQIDPFAVPEELEKQGFTPQVISAKVADQLEKIKQGIKPKRSEKIEERLSATSNVNAARLEIPEILERFSLTSVDELPDIEIPETKLSLRTIVHFLQDFLHRQPPRVTGEIILAKDAREQEVFAVTVRIVKGEKRYTQSFIQHPANPESMILTLGQEVLRLVDPAYLALWAYNQDDSDRTQKLLSECEQLDECPEHASKWVPILRGNILMNEDSLADAESEYRSALLSRGVPCEGLLIRYRLSRNNLEACTIAYIDLRNLLDVQKNYDLAIKQYQSALALNPKEAYAHNNWGNALSDEGEYDASIGQFEASISIKPSPYAYDGWASALSHKHEDKESIDKIQRAIELDPKFVMAYNDWGNALSDENENDAAIEKYQKALALDPKLAVAYDGWGTALYSKNDYDPAIEKFQKAVALDPKDAVAYNGWGHALYSKNDYDAAIEKFQKATALDPKLAVAYNGWGNALYSKNDYDAAIEKYQKAVALNPKLAVAYESWGMALEAKGDAEHATAMYRKAFTLNPTDEFLKSKLGK
ncbi:MAG: tetratricopeptide repeat protein [Candidatus Binataceae bacterium]